MFDKVLIANRGEIALRVIRACRERGIRSVAVYSEADRDALHVRHAYEAVPIGPAPSSESYLVGERIIEAALATGAQAIHPGYGFLSENAGFAEAVEAAGLVFIGPRPDNMRAMGDKLEARRAMTAAGVPVVPGIVDPVGDLDECRRICREIGYPVMLKASAGGGGKGMRRVFSDDELASAFAAARSEARSSFADDRVYIEKLVVEPRHIEIQLLSDQHGNHLHVWDRNCSVQRRNQKVIEESPSPRLPQSVREAMAKVAVRAAEALNYRGAGTVEFLVDADDNFYFLEMNTRLQVEHPITEEVVGIDLVQAQLDVALGTPLSIRQEDLVQRGHALECRIYAEDPASGFLPSPGLITGLRTPQGPGVRVDGAIYPGYRVPIHYDPLVAKLVTWGPDRAAAIGRMKRALREYVVQGIETPIGFFLDVLEHPAFVSGHYDTGFIPTYYPKEKLQALASASLGPEVETAALLTAAITRFERDRDGGAALIQNGGARGGWGQAGRLRRLGRF